jgi:hypothetical protein
MATKVSKMHQRVIDAKHRKEKAGDLIADLKESTDDPQLQKALDGLKNINLPVDPFWDIANKFYEDTRKNILDVNERFALSLQEKIDSPNGSVLSNNVRLAVLVNSLNSDIASMLSKLEAVHEKHKTFTGACKSTDEVILVMSINGEYSDINEAYFSLINSTVSEIMDITEMTNEIVAGAEEAAKSEELDPSVISDVEFKETSA